MPRKKTQDEPVYTGESQEEVQEKYYKFIQAAASQFRGPDNYDNYRSALDVFMAELRQPTSTDHEWAAVNMMWKLLDAIGADADNILTPKDEATLKAFTNAQQKPAALRAVALLVRARITWCLNLETAAFAAMYSYRLSERGAELAEQQLKDLSRAELEHHVLNRIAATADEAVPGVVSPSSGLQVYKTQMNFEFMPVEGRLEIARDKGRAVAAEGKRMAAKKKAEPPSEKYLSEAMRNVANESAARLPGCQCDQCGKTSVAVHAAGEPALRSCSRCHCVYYCSPECQRKDWKARHRVECRTPRQFEITDAVASPDLPTTSGGKKIKWRLEQRCTDEAQSSGADNAEVYWIARHSESVKKRVAESTLAHDLNQMHMRAPLPLLRQWCQLRGIEPPPACRNVSSMTEEALRGSEKYLAEHS